MVSEKTADVERGTTQTTTISSKTRSGDIQDAPSEKKDCDDAASQDGDRLDEAQDPNRPKGVRFALLYLCVLLGSFFIGYVRDTGLPTIANCQTDASLQDTSCVATLTPIITDEYHSLKDIGWYAIA
jgi:hypothetical protein